MRTVGSMLAADGLTCLAVFVILVGTVGFFPVPKLDNLAQLIGITLISTVALPAFAVLRFALWKARVLSLWVFGALGFVSGAVAISMRGSENGSSFCGVMGICYRILERRLMAPITPLGGRL